MNRDIFELTFTLLQAKGVFDKDKGVSAYKKILIEEFPFFEKALKLGSLYKKYFTIVHKLQVMELSELALNHNYYQIEIMKIKAKIKELENND